MNVLVAREIDALSTLSGLPCREFKSLIVSSKVHDPLDDTDDGAPPSLVEGHIFTDEASPLHQQFDELAAGTGIARKWDCDAGICYILPTTLKPLFESNAAQLGLGMQWGLVVVAKSIFTFIPPLNFTWIVTEIKLRSLPPINDASLTSVGTSSGDFRSDDFEYAGLASVFLTVKRQPIMGVLGSGRVTTFGLFNKPLLFAFQGGNQVDVMIQRQAGSIPPTQVIHTAIMGYLAPPKALDLLAPYSTMIEGTYN